MLPITVWIVLNIKVAFYSGWLQYWNITAILHSTFIGLHNSTFAYLLCIYLYLFQFTYLRHKSWNSYPLTNTSDVAHGIIASTPQPTWTSQWTKPIHDCKWNDCDFTSHTIIVEVLIRLTEGSQVFKWGGQWWCKGGSGGCLVPHMSKYDVVVFSCTVGNV